MAELLIFRHGPTIWNAEKRMQGRSDIPLSPTGENKVKQWSLPNKWMAVPWFVSPLLRAQQTAQLLGQDKFTIAPLLIEMSWGDWEGKRLPELRESLGPKMQEMEDMGLDLCPPGGESPRQVQRRLKPFLEKIAAEKQSVVSVAHKGILRALYASATGWDMLGNPPEKLRDNSAHLFQINDKGEIKLKELNLSLIDPSDDFPTPDIA